MIATLRSLGSFLNFDFASWRRNSHDVGPNLSESTWGRNTYFRFLSLKTADDTQMFVHRKTFAASAFCASGTHCDDGNTPSRISTFSWLMRRSASLMAVSTLLCASI